ncbi:MAG: hypothetical protein ACOY3M_01730 [Patescibacteria group bacterium]
MRPEREQSSPSTQKKESVSEHPVRVQLWRALEQATLEKEYTPDKERQKTVFDRISWDTFVEEIAKESTGTGEGAGKRLRGKLFEMLIQADPAFGQRSALEKELLALAHNPDAFGLGRLLGHHRNPDMAFLLVQKGNGVEITGVGESKLGLLNERSYKQLSETGFARGVKALVSVVNTLPDPERHGLVEVAKARKIVGENTPLLTVSPEFTQLLVVPANRNIAWHSSLINRKEFSMEGRQRFYELLSDIRHMRTANAAFSTAEVSAMANALRSADTH